MTVQSPDILALDFDGVICNGLIEYFQTAWKAYCCLWPDEETTPPDGLAEQFYALRPVVETGWEMPMLLRSLLQGISDQDILGNWPAIAQERLVLEQMEKTLPAQQVDGVRDAWIKEDVKHWLSQHQFYPGVIDRLREILASSTQVWIVTTKEGRFVRQLLQQENLDLPESRILGKEVKQPKYQTLQKLLDQASPSTSLWFIEDRLKALQLVAAESTLDSVELFLADWGYNLERDRHQATDSDRIHLISLNQFTQPFSAWIENSKT